MSIKDSGTSKTVSSSAPWKGQQPYLTAGFSAAANNYNSGAYSAPYYPGSTVADFSPEQQQAMAGTVARATNGSPLNAASSNYLTSVLNGNFLNSNPYTSQLAGQVGSSISDQLSRAGRYGGNNATTRGLTEGLAPVYNQNYQMERGMQQQAASLAPAQAAQDYVDLNALGAVGQQRQTQAQNLINSDIGRYNYYANLPYNSLQQYLGQIQGNFGGTQTTTQPTPSGLQQGLGAGVGLLGTLGSAYLLGGGSF